MLPRVSRETDLREFILVALIPAVPRVRSGWLEAGVEVFIDDSGAEPIEVGCNHAAVDAVGELIKKVF